jgi:hypothetical protein
MASNDQARPVDPVQAVRIRLAIRWKVAPEDISDHRVKTLIAKALEDRGEAVVAFQR